jgi:cell division septation protein DedD
MAASKGKGRGGGDWVLGGRQLFGVFVLLVVIFGMVFTLGYLLGRNQYESLRADASSLPVKPEGIGNKAGKIAGEPAEKTTSTAPSSPLTNWDFFRPAEPEKPAESAPEPPKSAKPAKSLVPSRTNVPGAVNTSPSPSIDVMRSNLKSVSPPPIPPGSTVLQIAAMSRSSDAVALAQALQQKKFPAFVLPPGSDRYYRVQVGPFTDAKSANLARQKLESQGFKAIARR